MSAGKLDRRGKILLVIGILLAIGAALGFIAGASYLVGFPSYDPGTATGVIAVCGVVPVVPAVLLIWLGHRDVKRAARTQALVGYVMGYRRIPMTDLATHLGIPVPDTEKAVAAAIGAGELSAFVDASTNEVVAAGVARQERFVGPCPRCGGQVDQWYLPGEAMRCPFCGTEFAARLPPP